MQDELHVPALCCVFLLHTPACLWEGLSELSGVILGHCVAPRGDRKSSSALWGGFWCTVSEWVHWLSGPVSTIIWMDQWVLLTLTCVTLSPPAHLQASLLQTGYIYCCFLSPVAHPIPHTPALTTNDSPLFTQFTVRGQFTVLPCCLVRGKEGNCSWCYLQWSWCSCTLSRKRFQFWRGRPCCDHVHSQNQKCQVIYTQWPLHKVHLCYLLQFNTIKWYLYNV